MKKIKQINLIVLLTLFFTLFYNYAFFTNTLKIYPFSTFVISLWLFLWLFLIFFFSLITTKWTIKPILIITLCISSLTAYFMDSYNIMIDNEMIENITQTDIAESLDLLTVKLFLYLFFLGVLPSFKIIKLQIEETCFKTKLKTIVVTFILMLSLVFLFSKHYASFIREHKSLRYYTNPTFWIYNIGKFLTNKTSIHHTPLKLLGIDAMITEVDTSNELVILVVGEAARADHFSLNGYKKETNPLLKKENIINFSNVYACGTSTAVSVPCMFSIFDKDNYSKIKGKNTENILDVLTHTGYIDILWRDNNSDSKGVADRIEMQDFKTSITNLACDSECRDEGMLEGLDNYIKKHPYRDIFIILHQMGNHGPAYYKRYPKEFEKFKPPCNTNQLERCTKEQISNSYDNALLYTDYFLSKVINLLKRYDTNHEVAMIYMSDHGESLGENNIYLHGFPYFIAPQAQIHIPTIFWFGNEMLKTINLQKLKNKSMQKFTHANLFHTLLGIFEVNSSVYKQKLDILDGCYLK